MTAGFNPEVLAALKKWQRRLDEAKFDDEPVYVTPEEMVELRAAAALNDIEKERLGIPTPPAGVIGDFIGTPVVVDRDKAAAQRSRWRT